jgi:hypothetical protein
MLSVNFPGAAELRLQAEVVRVLPRNDGWSDIHLQVPDDCAPAPVRYGHPVELRWSHLKSSTGLDADLTLILDVFEGRMVEILWLDIEYGLDEIPSIEDSRIFLSSDVGQGRFADGKGECSPKPAHAALDFVCSCGRVVT